MSFEHYMSEKSYIRRHWSMSFIVQYKYDIYWYRKSFIPRCLFQYM